jgi:sigma-B regulation protein RsbU (phosphoserine phosphatase)
MLVSVAVGAIEREKSLMPETILERLNLALMDRTGGGFVTCCCVRIEASGRAWVASAGHPATWVLDRSGAVKARMLRTGLPLGRQTRGPYAENAPVPLVSGDTVVILTDGIDEAMRSDGSLFGIDRALDLVRNNPQLTSTEMADRICREARKFTEPEPQTDDFTVVIVRVL